MSDAVVVSLQGAERLNRRLKRYKDAPGSGGPDDPVWQAMGESALSMQKGAKENVVSLGAVDTGGGGLLGSIHIRPDLARLQIAVGTEKAHAKYVHDGAGPAVGHAPFFPPGPALEPWAARHGMAGAGWAIARSIFKRGFKPRPFLQYAADDEADKYLARMAKALRDFFRRD